MSKTASEPIRNNYKPCDTDVDFVYYVLTCFIHMYI